MSRKSGKDLEMSPHSCGLLCSACKCCTGSSVSALDFYREEVRTITINIETEKAQLQSNAIGIAFVTLSNLADAKTINTDHRKILSCFSSHPPTSSLDSHLQPGSWDIRFAPPQEDIYWENLNRKKNFR